MASTNATPIPFDEAELLGLFLNSMLYALVLLTLLFCLHVLLSCSSRPRARSCQWPMVVIACVMGALSTADMVLAVCEAMKAFIFYRGGGGASAEYAQSMYTSAPWLAKVRCIS